MSQVDTTETYNDIEDQYDEVEQDTDDEDTIEVSPIVESFVEHINKILDDDQTRVKQLGSKVSELFEDALFKEQMNLFAEEAEGSSTFFVDQFTVVDWEVTTVSIGQIIEGSQFQEQYGILSTAINSLFLDKLTGLANNLFLMMMPVAEIIVREDGTSVTVGGHHRTSAVCLMFASGGLSWGEILDMQVPVLQGSINLKKLAELNDVPISRVTEFERELEARLWMASNKSRKPTAAESSDYNNNKKGIVLSDPDSVLNNSILSTKDKLVNYFLSVGYSEGILPDKKTGATERSLVAYPNATGEERFWPDPKPQTFLQIGSAFYAALGKITIGGEAKEGSKAKKVKKWEPSLKNVKALVKVVEWIYTPDQRSGLCPLEEAIPRGLAKSDKDYGSNIARNASKVGQELALLLDERVEPIIPASAPKAGKKEKTAVKGSKFKARNVRA